MAAHEAIRRVGGSVSHPTSVKFEDFSTEAHRSLQGGCVFVGSTPVMCVLSFLDTGSIVYGSKGGGKGSASPRPNGASSSARSRSVEEAIPTVLVGGAWQSWAFSSGLRESANGLVEHMLRSMVFAVPWYWQIW